MPSKINSGKWGGVSQRVQTSSYMINKIWASIYNMIVIISKHCCFSLVTMLCLTLFDLMNYSTPGFLVLHYLPEFAQSHVHWASDAIQPSHPLSSPSPAFNLSQHQGLFKWVSSLHQVAKVGVSASTSVLPMDWSPLGWTGWISLQSKGLSRIFSNSTVQKHQFFHSAFFRVQLLYHTWLLEKTIPLTIVGKAVSLLFNIFARFVKLLLQGTSIY